MNRPVHSGCKFAVRSERIRLQTPLRTESVVVIYSRHLPVITERFVVEWATNETAPVTR